MPNDRDPLLSQRTALVLALSLFVSIAAAALRAWGGASPQEAALTGGAAFFPAVLFFHAVIA
ncbi:hypothetical protein JK359_08325 [Streptomyces actinomycinicus]|uniref:Uncharacterized protein n=1 Tax=Streptomyces actinomycinicus TaxID=1695166 RepID=A0A937EGR8_9ACTN|nr:hypothetical protein [Streptomyces actinomycinicus]MBL1081990.1 hypothetical protein [Streptomyces actinomycinicus]